MEGVEKCFVAPYGNALVAVRDYAPGDVVIRDRPLLATLECSDLLDEVYEAHRELGIRADLVGKDASIDFTLQLLQYCGVDDGIKAAVRKLFTPDVQRFHDEPYVRAARQYAQQLVDLETASPDLLARSLLGRIVASCAPDEVVRVVLAWVCNCYSTCDGGGALYEYGSLVNHCCEGNTRYRFVDGGKDGDGYCVFIAVRHIHPGDVITTCYLGWDEQTLMSTRMRRKLLVKTKLFTCTCERCSRQRDPYRSVPCPACNQATAGAVTVAAAGAAAAADGDGGGFLCWNDTEDSSGGNDEGEGGLELRPWECDACGRRYSEEQVRKALRRRAATAATLAEGVTAGGRAVGSPVVRPGGAIGNDAIAVTAAAAAVDDGGDNDGDDDPELALEEEVHSVGEQLDWTDLTVSLGAVRRLGARCLAVLGNRHWATNRCRYTVVELCTAALRGTYAASRSGGSLCSGWTGAAASVRGSAGGDGLPWCDGSSGGGGAYGGCSRLAVGSSTAEALRNEGLASVPEEGATPVSGAAGGVDANCRGGGSDGLASADSTGGALTTLGKEGAPPEDDTKPRPAAPQGRLGDGIQGRRRNDYPLLPPLLLQQQTQLPECDPQPPAGSDRSAASLGRDRAGLIAVDGFQEVQGCKVDGVSGEDTAAASTPGVMAAVQPKPGQHEAAFSTGGSPSHLGRQELLRHTLHQHRLHQRQLEGQQHDVPEVPAAVGTSDCAGAGSGRAGLDCRTLADTDEGLPVTASSSTAASRAAPAATPLPQGSLPAAGDLCSSGSQSPPPGAVSGDPTPESKPQLQSRVTLTPVSAFAPGSTSAAGTPAMVVAALPLAAGAAAACGAEAVGAAAAFGANPVVDMAPAGAEAVGSGAGAEAAADSAGACGGAAAIAGPKAAAAALGGGLGAAGLSVGGSSCWSLVEVEAMVRCICEELQALWQWQQQHTPDEPAVVLKAVAGPAATALMDAVKDELVVCGPLACLALDTAESTATRLAAVYSSAPHYDVSGTAHAEAVSVLELCPLIRKLLDLPSSPLR